MKNEELRNAKRRGPGLALGLAFFILHSAFCVLNSTAAELTVDRHSLTLEDTLTITLSLDDPFYDAEVSALPLQNLRVDGQPSVATSFQWINGETSRQKIVRYVAHPLGAGEAVVGPLVLHGAGGRVETLPAIAVQVAADVSMELTDPAAIMQQLLASGRDPIFIIAEADRKSVYTGEEVVVTWTLYNATNIQQFAMTEQPRFDDFWAEELRVTEHAQQTRMGGVIVQSLPVRRVALFPLRSGTLQVPSMAASAAVMKHIRTANPFGEFEGTVVDVRRRSAPLVIEAKPLPPGPPVAIVGDVTLDCSAPSQSNGGPVAMDVVVKGRANLRAMTAPRFAKAIDGTQQIVEGRVTTDSSNGEAVMTRRWRYLLFPARSGFFVVPPLTLQVLTTTGERRELRCAERVVEVQRAVAEPPAPVEKKTFVAAVRRAWIPATVAALLVVALAIAAPRVQERMRVRREVGKILHSEHADIVAAAEEWLREREIDPAALLREPSDRGDAYRAFRSLADQRIEAGTDELRRRARDLVTAVSR